jgi:hypothetical protein
MCAHGLAVFALTAQPHREPAALAAMRVRQVVLPSPPAATSPGVVAKPAFVRPEGHAARAPAQTPAVAATSRPPPTAAAPRREVAARAQTIAPPIPPQGRDADTADLLDGATHADAAPSTQPSVDASLVHTALGEAADAPPPVYRTRIPASALLQFTLQRGDVLGEASLDWQVDGERYALSLHAVLPQGRTIEQRSQGTFDTAGVAPVRLADRRSGRDVRAANFQREHQAVSFSGPRWQLPLVAGAQDRLSWLVQLVAIAAASPERLQEGAEVSLWVVGTRGAASTWRFEVRGQEALSHTMPATQAWRLVREPTHPYDLRIEVWLDPQRQHWPARMRQTQVPGGEPLQWTLRDVLTTSPSP